MPLRMRSSRTCSSSFCHRTARRSFNPSTKGSSKASSARTHKRLIQRLILNTRLGRETKTDLLGSTVVANCFCHAGFTVQCAETSDSATEVHDDDADRDEDRLLDQDEEIAVAWADLRESDVPGDVHLSEFMQADSCSVVREERTDEDIIKSVQEGGVSSDVVGR